MRADWASQPARCISADKRCCLWASIAACRCATCLHVQATTKLFLNPAGPRMSAQPNLEFLAHSLQYLHHRSAVLCEIGLPLRYEQNVFAALAFGSGRLPRTA